MAPHPQVPSSHACCTDDAPVVEVDEEISKEEGEDKEGNNDDGIFFSITITFIFTTHTDIMNEDNG